jgi:glycosyltransferase involved in cell wall biosynthesis
MAAVSSALGLFRDPGEAMRWGGAFLSTEAAMKLAARTAHVILWEPRGGVQPRAKAIRDLSRPVLALPQNIESLVAPFIGSAGNRGWHRFRGELEALSACAGVLTISREEQWLLGSIGVPAEYLPYVPSTARRQWLGNIRRLRETCTQDSILVLGTQSNEPTRRGVGEIVEALAGRKGQQRVVVVGVGSDVSLAPTGSNSEIQNVGFLSDEDLLNELSRASVALVWQPATSGWPTRLVELPECGIPVIANRGALRGQESYPGVALARTTADAISFLRSPPPIKLGVDSTRAESDALATVKEMISVLEHAE